MRNPTPKRPRAAENNEQQQASTSQDDHEARASNNLKIATESGNVKSNKALKVWAVKFLLNQINDVPDDHIQSS